MNTFSKDMKTLPPLISNAILPAIAAAMLLLIPFLAMQFGEEFNWSVMDFVIAWLLLFGAGYMYKLVSGKSSSILYKSAAGIAAVTGLFLIWSNLAVGLIGSENNPANLMYLGVLFVLLVGSLISRLKSIGMVFTLSAAAFTQILVTLIAIVTESGVPENTPVQLVMINGFFIVLWCASALLFWLASRENYSR